MPLQRATKSIVLHEGISDGADRFLVEPPAVDYAENYRVHKDGSLQKRPGFGPDALTAVPDADGEPFFLHGMGNSLHALTEDGSRTWDGSEWSASEDVDGFIGTSALTLETPTIRGLGGCVYQPGYDVDGNVIMHVIAGEIRAKGSPDAAYSDHSKHIVVQWFDADGRLFNQVRVSDARSPSLVNLTSLDDGVLRPEILLFYQDSTSLALTMRRIGTLQLSLEDAFPFIVFSNPVNLGLLVREEAGIVDLRADPETGSRLGGGVSAIAQYKVALNGLGNEFYVFIQSHTGGLTLTKFDIAGSQVGSTLPIALPQYRCQPLASYFGYIKTSGYLVLLYQTWHAGVDSAPGSGDWALTMGFVNTSTMTLAFEHDLKSGSDLRLVPMFDHGSITAQIDSFGDPFIHVAAHRAGRVSASPFDNYSGDPDYQNAAHYWWPFNTRDRYSGTEFYSYDIQSQSSRFMCRAVGQRLTTDIQMFKGQLYAGLQQWIDYTPQESNPGGVNTYRHTLPSAKPVTTALCVIQTDKPPKPVASIDAGISSLCDYAESEQFLHLGTIAIYDDSMHVSNRVKLSAESTLLYNGGVDGLWQRTSDTDVSSEALVRVHKVSVGDLASGVSAAALGDGVALSTAVPMWFDGRVMGEFGPLDSPEIMRIYDDDYDEQRYVDNAAVRGQMEFPPHAYDQDGVIPDDSQDRYWRKFVAIYGYTDSKGNIHRSAPSSTLYVGDVGEGRATPQDPPSEGKYFGRSMRAYITPPVTMLTAGMEYFVELYVSSNEDDDPQLVTQSQVDLTDYQHPVQLSFQLNRAVQDDVGTQKPVIRSSKAPYTTGGILAADPWPSFKNSVATSTRFWALDSVNRGRVLPSKLFEDWIAPEYNSTLAINIGDERDLTAIGKLDDKVIVFEQNDIHVIYGDGPDNRGQGQDFAVHYIATDVGCIDQESIVETPHGLIFYSHLRGFYMLDRNLQVTYIGHGCEEIARDINVTSALLVPDAAEVRFAFSGGPSKRLGPDADTSAVTRPPRPVFTNTPPDEPALSYNYERKTWSVYSNYDAQASTMYQGKYTFLRSDWDIWQESEDRWDDPASTNAGSITTPWIKLAENVQGFNRLWHMEVLGRYLSSLQDMGDGEYEASDIRVNIYFDYEATPSQSERINFRQFGYNVFDAVPKRAERFQFRVEPKRGRCQSIKLEFVEVLPEDNGEGIAFKIGHGFEISSVDFHMGIGPSRALLPQQVKV